MFNKRLSQNNRQENKPDFCYLKRKQPERSPVKGTFFVLLSIFLLCCLPVSANAGSRSVIRSYVSVVQTMADTESLHEQISDGLYRKGYKIYYYISGKMQTGWQEIDGQHYYFSPETGAALTGKKTIGNAVYYFHRDGTMHTGWKKRNGQTYYFDDKTGKMQTGWQNIYGQKYYLSPREPEKGALLKNCIAGTEDTGFYYVDQSGIQVKDAGISAAVRYIRKYAKENQTSAVKLQKCYEALQNNFHYRTSQEIPDAQKLSAFAYDLLTNEKGNCYRYAAGFACIAKVLGYESRIQIGNVSGRYGEMEPHGWAEVKHHGVWYKCDVNMGLFMYAGKTSRTYSNQKTYQLMIHKGNAVWKLQE